jgi:RNA polymerase sigma factor (sigma-70 family)
MNVVRLFPASESEEEAPSKSVRSGQAVRHSGRTQLLAPSPARILARSVGGPGRGGVTPAAVIARSLDRPQALEGFWAVWMAHQTTLRRRSLRLSGGNRAEAEDALSVAMVRAAQAFDRQPVQNPGAWLVRILYNACMDQHRQNVGRITMGSTEADLPSPASAAWLREEPSPEEALDRQEWDAAWGRAMNALPAALVEPLRLYLDDWSDEDIAAHLSISRELVRKRRQLAKNRLRLLLDL